MGGIGTDQLVNTTIITAMVPINTQTENALTILMIKPASDQSHPPKKQQTAKPVLQWLTIGGSLPQVLVLVDI